MADGPRKRNATDREVLDATRPSTDVQSTSIDSPPTTSPPKPNAAEDDPDNVIDTNGTAHRTPTNAEREAAALERKERSRWRVFWDKYGSVELENKGSVARDHLALERTFLAWLRTSLSFASIGIAITQLFRLNTSLSDPSRKNTHRSPTTPFQSPFTYDDPNTPDPNIAVTSSAHDSPQAKLRHLGKPLGATFIGISIVILCIGFHRYFEAQHYVIRGKFPASRGSVLVVSFISGVIILSSLVVILVTAPSAFET